MAMDVRCYREKAKKDEWVIDSGAICHMTYCKEGLVNYRSISTAVRVVVILNCISWELATRK